MAHQPAQIDVYAGLVEDITGDPTERVTPDADAFEVLVSMGESRAAEVVVFDGDEFVGVVGQEDVLESIKLLQGIGPADRELPRPEDGYA